MQAHRCATQLPSRRLVGARPLRSQSLCRRISQVSIQRLAKVRQPLPQSGISSASLFNSSAGSVQRRAQSDDFRKKGFRGQLYESTIERVAREKREEEALRKHRRDRDSSRRWLATLSVLAASLGMYWLGGLRVETAPTTSTTPLAQSRRPDHDVSRSNLQAAWADMVQLLGKENVSTDPGDVDAHASSDWSSYTNKAGERPFMVVRPASTEDVSSIMKICYARKIPVTAYSGGTSLEGHYAPTRGGVCVAFERMDKIITVHKEDLDCVVQPAVGWELLNEELEKENLFFPPDPGPGAMIGGMVGTGCSGTNAYRYGTMREWVLSLTVVLADGTIIKTRQRPRKSSAGYDLTKLFIGSEGTLGLVTEATLKLTVLPKSQNVAVASFNSVREAASCVAAVVGEGIQVAAVELLDDVQMQCINKSGTTSRKWKEKPTLLFKFTGTKAGVKEQIDIVQRLAKGKGSQSFEFAKNADEMKELWSARKEALWSVMALKRHESDHVWTTDVAVPISRLPGIIEETKQDISKSGLLGAIVGHVGDGNFHVILLFSEQERSIAEAVTHRMVHRAIEMEGTVTGEHGVGLIKRDYLPAELGEDTVNAMRRIKQSLDPLCLLNCDKIVRAEPVRAGEAVSF